MLSGAARGGGTQAPLSTAKSAAHTASDETATAQRIWEGGSGRHVASRHRITGNGTHLGQNVQTPLVVRNGMLSDAGLQPRGIDGVGWGAQWDPMGEGIPPSTTQERSPGDGALHRTADNRACG